MTAMPEPLTVTAAAILLPYTSALATPWTRNNVLRSDTAASIQQRVFVLPPTGVTSVRMEMHAPVSNDFDDQITASVGWMDLAQAVFGGSRSMTDEERAALDDFTWAELRS
jgi:hypothetical protein